MRILNKMKICEFSRELDYDLKGIFENGLPCCKYGKSCPHNLGKKFNLGEEIYFYCKTNGNLIKKSRLTTIIQQPNQHAI